MMTTLTPLQQIYTLFGLGVAAVICWWWLVRALGWSTTSYGEVWKIVKENPIAVAILRGSMYLATAYLVADIFSRFVG